MLVPTSISLSRLALKVKGNKTFISSTYIAYFGEGREKMLNKKEWVLSSLLKPCEISFGEPVNTFLHNDTCSLYYKDWSNVPMFGLWDKDYPTINIIPKEITDLIPNSIFA